MFLYNKREKVRETGLLMIFIFIIALYFGVQVEKKKKNLYLVISLICIEIFSKLSIVSILFYQRVLCYYLLICFFKDVVEVGVIDQVVQYLFVSYKGVGYEVSIFK